MIERTALITNSLNRASSKDKHMPSLNTPAEETQTSADRTNKPSARKPYQAPRLEQLATTATNNNFSVGTDGLGSSTAS
jgi:hypothetical protein